jgi:predicted Zn-dependent peptidase
MSPIPRSQKTVLPNGLKVITERVSSVRSVSLGIFVGCGSNLELPEEAGISHLIEHMNFKGTPSRTAFQIAEEIDAIGGKINAYTSKEYTCFYTITLDKHVQIAISVLSDLFLNSLYAPTELELERGVVLEEIKMSEDAPDEHIHEVFMQTIMAGHPLGENILGTEKSVAALKRKDILSYRERFYTPDNIIICATGNLWHWSMVSKIEKAFKHLEGKARFPKVTSPKINRGIKVVPRKTEQVHFCIGTKSSSQLDPDRYAFVLLDNILGGSMSSRLFQEIREKRGLAYSVYSSVAPFKNCGVFYIYVGCNKEHVEESLDVILNEFRNILKEGITKAELKRAKEFVKGSLVLGLESTSSRMSWIARAEYYYGGPLTIAEVFEEIDKITVDTIIEVANKYITEKTLALALLGDIEEAPVKELNL